MGWLESMCTGLSDDAKKVSVGLSGEKKFRQTFSNGHLKAWSLYIPHPPVHLVTLPVLKPILPSSTLRSKRSELN
uniref:Uncharacterized protein n=1 Tax=Arundo donax TaxID=35708 RepID=A0A0A9H807_ARUDO